MLLPKNRILLLANYRLGYEHGWSGHSFYAQLHIGPLGPAIADEFLDALMGQDDSLAALKTHLINRTGGNPLYLEESVQTLIETEVLAGERGAYRVTRAVDTITIPDSVQAIISARIDRLGIDAKRVLQSAAVVGKQVPYSVLEAVAGMDEDKLRRGLAELQAAEFMYETQLFPDLEYTFKHALINEVGYSSVLKTQRQELHRRAGEAIERLYQARLPEFAEALASHFERGEVWEKAVEYLLLASKRSKEQFAYVSAAELCTRATAAARRGTGTVKLEVRSLVLSGDVVSLIGDLEGANDFYAQAVELERDSREQTRITNRFHRPHQISRDGATITYYEHGDGDVTLLFVPALSYGLAVYQPLIEQLCQDFRIITYDPIGTGKSDPIPPGYTADDQVLDTAAIIEASGAAPAVLIGASRAGNVSLKLAALRPDLVGKVVTVCAAVDDWVHANTRSPLPLRIRAEIDSALAADDLERAFMAWAAMILTDPGTQDLARGFVQRSMKTPAAARNFLDAHPELNVAPILSKVRAPTLIMHGMQDLRVSEEDTTYLVRHIAHAKRYDFEGKGHLPSYTAADEFCAVLRAFARGDSAVL